MGKRTLGAELAHSLKIRGVETIFGIPGVHNVELYRGIEDAGIRHILARHEQGAGFMADGYARATGKPGVAFVISGPGLTNIMTPMGQAYSDSVPVLVVSSCLDETAAHKGQLHQMRDQEGAAATVCDWSLTAQDSDSAYHLVDRAFTEFYSQRQRPKHIQVPIKALGAAAIPAPEPETLPDSPPYLRPVAHQRDIERIANALLQAERPLIIFGGGAVCYHHAARKVAKLAGAAVFTTYAGRGIVDPEYSLNCGAYLARPESAQLIASADLVLAVGTTLAEVDLWRRDLGHTCTFIRVDLDASVMAHPRADIRVVSDAGAVLDGVARLLPANKQTGWNAGQIENTCSQWHAQTDAERPGIAPLCEAMQAALPDDTMYFSDMTQFAYVAKEVCPMNRPGHWHHPFGFGTLGYALPAAIGGKVSRLSQPTVSIAGDYGFQYTMQELGVAAELNLTLPIILWDNGKLKEIEDSMIASQIAPNAVVAQNPDFRLLAAAYGVAYEAPTSITAFQDALRASLKADGPTIIHITAATNA